MKLLLMVYTGSSPHRVTHVLETNEVSFTEIDRAHGRGLSGRVEGTRAWPGENSLFLSVVPDEKADAVEQGLRALSPGAAPGERLHTAVLPVEHFF